jgi:hypothetical protein
MTNNKFYGLIHFIITLWATFHGLITNKNNFDKIYILYTIISFISWIYFDGYCFISYFYDENNNKSPLELNDFYTLFDNKYNNLIDNFLFINIFITALSLYIVLLRNNYLKSFSLIICFMYIYYRLMLRISSLKIINNKIIIEYYKAILIIIFFFILQKENYIKFINL